MSHSSFAAMVRTGGEDFRQEANRKSGRLQKNLSPGRVFVRRDAPQNRQGGPLPRLRVFPALARSDQLPVCFPVRHAFAWKSASGWIAAFMSIQTGQIPKRRPRKIRYAQPLACQGGKALPEG